MRLGDYGFEWNPDKLTVPESKKTVAVQDTYNGSALFQWTAVLEGTQVDLQWEWMSVGMYNSLRALYLGTGEIRWIAGAAQAFMCVPTRLDSTYFETALDDIAYRKEVSLRLSLRTTATVAYESTTTSV
jgi:hypothetical protein